LKVLLLLVFSSIKISLPLMAFNCITRNINIYVFII
jgi:hypothetical protein